MVGPCAMDLGVLIANYIFAYYHHMLNPHDNDAHRQVAYKLLDICHKSGLNLFVFVNPEHVYTNDFIVFLFAFLSVYFKWRTYVFIAN